MTKLEARKAEALREFKAAKAEIKTVEDVRNKEKWSRFCEAQKTCRLLGVII